MLSYTKERYASVVQDPMVFAFDDREKFTTSAGMFFGYSDISLGYKTNDQYQQGRVDTRVFNFTKSELTHISRDGFRVRLEPISVNRYMTKDRTNLRTDVAALVSCFGYNLVDNLVIMQRRVLHGNTEAELVNMIMTSTIHKSIKEKMVSIPKKNLVIGGRSYYVCDVVMLFNIVDNDFGDYVACMEANTGEFFSKEPYSNAQPHPDDRNIEMVNAELFCGDVTKSGVSSFQHVYSGAKPPPVFFNFLGTVIKIPQVFSDNLKEGIHLTTGTPSNGKEKPKVSSEYISLENMTEANGIYTDEMLALLQLRQEQYDKRTWFVNGMAKGLFDIGKGVDRAFVDGLSKAFFALGESRNAKSYILESAVSESVKRLDRAALGLIEVTQATKNAELIKKMEYDMLINQHKADQEKLKMVPVAIGAGVTILSLLSKKK